MRARLLANRDGTLRFTPPGAENLAAAIDSATVSIALASGLALPTPVVDASATVTDLEFSYALAAAQLREPAVTGTHLYRAEWAYVSGGKTYRADQLFEVRKRLLLSTLTEEEVLRNLPARIDELQENGSIKDGVAGAWDDLLDDLAGKGFDPDRVMDADRLRRPHREKTIALLARAWGSDWREWATAREAIYDKALGDALSAGDWYDLQEDAVQTAGETKSFSISLTR